MTPQHEPTCRKCGSKMQEGIALLQTYVSSTPDFPGDTHGITMSAGGQGTMAKCWKCPECGHSISKTDQEPKT